MITFIILPYINNPIIDFNNVISVGGAIILAVVVGTFGIQQARMNNLSKNIKAVRVQTENSHIDNPEKVSNLRVNLDVNHDDIVERVDRVIQLVMNVDETQRKQSTKIDKLFSMVHKNTENIEKLMKEEN